MSGFAGLIRWNERVDGQVIERMTAAMPHRGLDGIAHDCEPNAVFGHCLTRTTPESFQEQQPLRSPDGRYVLLMSGFLENPQEVRAELLRRGVLLRNTSDSELVLQACIVWGPDAWAQLEGEYAIALWDARTQRLVLVKDRSATKPLFVSLGGRGVVFASEVKAILASGEVDAVLDDAHVAEHLLSRWHSLTATLWKGIKRVRPAEVVTVSQGGVSRSRYWTPQVPTGGNSSSTPQWVERHRELLFDVVRRQSRASGVLACEVSGGLDSSALYAVAHELQRHGSLLAERVQGYHLAFTGDRRADEVRYVDAIERHLGTSVTRVEPSHFPLAFYTERALARAALPGPPNLNMSRDLFAASRAQGARVILCGLGGDEWLGPAAHPAWRAFHAHWLGSLFRSVRSGALLRAPNVHARAAISALIPASVRLALEHWRSRSAYRHLSPQASVRFEPELLPPLRPGCVHERLDWYRHFPFAILNRDLCELQAAEHGIQLRQPYWNHRIVEHSYAMPDDLKERAGLTKWCHRQAFADLLPREVIERADKAEFSLVYDHLRPDLHASFDRLSGTGSIPWLTSRQRLDDNGVLAAIVCETLLRMRV